jgi:hypothetical protein
MALPKNTKLYEKVKKFIYKKYPLHSAYRSGLLVKKYKELGGTYIGKRKGPLARWFKEDWKSDTGHYGYTSKSSVYRPTKRISKKTPITFSELSRKEILRAKKEKYRKGYVTHFSLSNFARTL